MQSLTVVAASTTLRDSLTPLLNNDLTALSNSSGTAFPTTNLQIGMLCYRTDTTKLYELTSTGPSVWTLLADLTKSPVQTDGSGNATITGLFTSATLTAGATTITGLLTAASASITGALAVGGVLALTNAANFAKAADIASAATCNIGAALGNYLNITGAVTITAFDTVQAGTERLINFTGALQITYNATNMQLPGGLSIKTAAGDKARFLSLGSGNWVLTHYIRANGQGLTYAGPENNIASASTCDLGTAGSNQVNITGTVTVTSFGSSASALNPLYFIRFAAALTLTYNATNLLLPGSANITTAAGDGAIALYLGSGNWRVLAYYKADGTAIAAATSVVVSPQGRLTLTSNTPIMTSDVTAGTSIYYTPYIGNQIPIYNGTSFVNKTFSQLTQALDSTAAHTGYQQSAKLFDIFVFLNAGVVTLGTGPAWSSSTARSNALAMLNGIWTNNASIVLKIDATATTVTVPANQATYVGTMRGGASDGTCPMVFKPTPTGGGTNNILGLWNAYNRVPTTAIEGDSTTTFTSTNVWAPMNGSSSNAITWVDGLGQSGVKAEGMFGTIGSGGWYAGITLDSTSAAPSYYGTVQSTINVQITATEYFAPSIGTHSIYAMGNGNVTWIGAPQYNLRATLDM